MKQMRTKGSPFRNEDHRFPIQLILLVFLFALPSSGTAQDYLTDSLKTQRYAYRQGGYFLNQYSKFLKGFKTFKIGVFYKRNHKRSWGFESEYDYDTDNRFVKGRSQFDSLEVTTSGGATTYYDIQFNTYIKEEYFDKSHLKMGLDYVGSLGFEHISMDPSTKGNTEVSKYYFSSVALRPYARYDISAKLSLLADFIFLQGIIGVQYNSINGKISRCTPQVSTSLFVMNFILD